MHSGESLTITVAGTSKKFDFYDSGAGAYVGSNTGIDVAAGKTIASALASIQTALQAGGGAASS